MTRFLITLVTLAFVTACTANYLPSCTENCKQGSDKAFDLNRSQ